MRVLLVDDEKSIRLTLGDDLEDAGYDVVLASEGKTALEKLMTEHFDCLITDLKLPGASGIKLLKTGREHNSDLAAIVITGFGTVESAVEAMKLGASDYLLKPFINEEVILRLKNIAKLFGFIGPGSFLSDKKIFPGEKYRHLVPLPEQKSSIQMFFSY